MATQTKKAEILQVAVSDIIPDANQPRQSFNEDENIELAKSVAKDGILQPILLRPSKSKGSKFMVVFGHRRLWAAKYNHLEVVPAQVKDLTDDEALHIQVIENLQRKNINPMEEADAFSRLITKSITTAEQIADELGVSTKYVYDRLALKKVIDPVQDMVRNGKLSISHGKQFARLKKEDQEKLWDNWASNIEEEDLSISDLRREISTTFTYKLADAIFSTAEPKLIPKAGSCEKCQKRSGCNILLFDDIQQEDICFDKACYQKKTDAHLDKKIKELEAEGKKVVKISALYGTAPDGTISFNDWNKCSVGKENALGIVVAANAYSNFKIGEVIPIQLSNWGDDEDEEDNDDEGDSDQSGAMKKGINQLLGRPSYVDHDDVLSKRVIQAIVKEFNENPTFHELLDFEDLLRDEIKSSFSSMNDETAAQMAEVIGVELSDELKEDPSSYQIGRIINDQIPSSKLKAVCLLSKLVTDAEMNYDDAEDLQKLEETLSSLGISAKAIAKQYSTESDYKLPE
jgi:ParB/RepB/Spo0J family partition protein